MANTTKNRGAGHEPRRVVLEAPLGRRWRALAAALEVLEHTAVGEVGDGEALAFILAAAYEMYPTETITALGRLVVMVRQDRSAEEAR